MSKPTLATLVALIETFEGTVMGNVKKNKSKSQSKRTSTKRAVRLPAEDASAKHDSIRAGRRNYKQGLGK